jgi:Uma2 family endonuclease
MSAKVALQDFDFDLVQEDGVPLESYYHVLQMILFLELASLRLQELGYDDAFIGADMFVYYSNDQAQTVAEEERQLELFKQGLRPDKPENTAFRGPDVFLVKEAAKRERSIWVAWEEDDRFPDLILELLSPSTAAADYGEKKRIYQDVFKTSEYFLYAPRAETIDGFRLLDNAYQPIQRSAERRLWSRELEAELGVWYGEFRGKTNHWLRLYYPDGSLMPTWQETAGQASQGRREAELGRQEAELRVEQERLKAEQERQRADDAERELARLRARLDKKNN